MSKYKRLGIGLSGLLLLTTVALAGCATNGSQQLAGGGTTPPTNQTITNTTNLTPPTSNGLSNAVTPNITSSNSTTKVGIASSRHENQSSVKSPNVAWNSVVVQSMTQIKKNTSVPLVAATYIGQSKNLNYPYLTAITNSVRGEYRVAFHLTSTELGVDNPAINQPQNTGLAAYVGSYAATEFPNSNRASHSLKQFTIKIPSSAAWEAMNLGDGVTGRWFLYGNTATMQWNEGKWICQIVGGSKEQELQESGKIVAYLNKHLLPERPGVLVVMQTGDGNHTEIHWAIGNIMFSTSNYHHAMNAIKMAMSLRLYPSGQSSGVQY